MCLMPGSGGITCVASARALKLGSYVKTACVMLGILCLLMLPNLNLNDLLFSAIACGVGYMGVKDPHAYAIQQIFCFVFITGLQGITTSIKALMLAGGVDFWQLKSSSGSSSGGTMAPTAAPSQTLVHLFNILVIVSPFVYIPSCYVGVKLYNELRDIINDPSGLYGSGGGYGGPQGGGAIGGPSQNYYNSQGGGSGIATQNRPAPFHGASNPGANPYEERPAAGGRGQAAGGFKPFSGQGHSLV